METAIAMTVTVILLFSAGMTIYRMTAGPTIFDRSMAADVLVSIFSIAIATEMIINDNTDNITLLIVLAVMNFIGSVVLSRYADKR